MNLGRNLTAVAAAWLTVSALCAQNSAELLAGLRALKLKEADGPVKLMYSAGAGDRAVRWQHALSAAHEWFQQELHMQVPVTLAVLDREHWKQVTEGALPH